MNHKELRIGNYVLFNETQDIVYAIKNSGIDFFRGKKTKGVITQGYIHEAIKPIPLTEEWLLKFGFDSQEKGYNYLTIGKSALYIYINNNGETGICIEDLNEDLTEEQELSFSIKIQFVHQLQNLYFALTNEELTIKQ